MGGGPGRAHVDFETFCAAGKPKDLGSVRYAEDPSTEAICLGWAIGDEEPELWVPGDPPPERLFRHVRRGGTVHAWNAGFEEAIWNIVCTRLYGWPELPLDQLRDTAAEAAALGFPLALEHAGPAAGVPLEHLKDKRGKHLINKLCGPRKPSKHNPATRWTPEAVPQDFRDFYAYCRQDVVGERAVHLALPFGLSEAELETWRMTMRLNRLGWTVDLDLAERMIRLLAEHKTRLEQELRELTDGYVTTGGQRDKILTWLATEHFIMLSDLQAETVSGVLATGRAPCGRFETAPIPGGALRVLEIRQLLAKSSVRKFQAILQRVCSDGRCKDLLVYCGASNTGRDAGRGIQIQNFPRASVGKTEDAIETAVRVVRGPDPLASVEILWGSPPQFASGMLRPTLVAAPGRELFCADFSSVENRVTVWLAQDEYGMGVFRKGLDQYTAFITDSQGIPYDDVTPDQRTTAKPIVLGCCFGMGDKTFMGTQLSNGVECTLAEAKEAVDTYRGLHPGVVSLWYDLNKAAIRCVQTGSDQRVRLLRFERDDDFLRMVLPSGRFLSYHRPRVESVRMPWGERKPAVTCVRTFSGGARRRTTMSPGLFTENAVQATARDLLMHAAKNAERAGYPSVGRVHDELVSEREIGSGSLEGYLKQMLNMPRWFTDPGPDFETVPMDAEGWRGRRYRKG